MDTFEDIHPHCIQCIKHLKCTVVPKPGTSCNIITCPLLCGARFHACKAQEHKLLCMNERVVCINVEYGCPAVMPRKNRGSHLNSCPASVIHCSEEWDRWPIHTHDARLQEDNSFKSLAAEGHLDVALAMRDQRMLHRWCIAAQQQHKATLKDQNFKVNQSSSQWILKKWRSIREYSYPPGLELSVCNELCRTCNKTLSSNIYRFNSIPYCHARNSHVGLKADGLCSSNKNLVEQENEDSNQNQTNQVCNSTEAEFIPNGDITNQNEDEQCSQFNLDDVLLFSQLDWITYDPTTNEGYMRYMYGTDTAKNSSESKSKQTLACEILDFKFQNPSSTPPWCLPLGFDLNLESRSQHQASNFMYTFLCCQVFRRDEYGWHYKNVHSEIYSGLNGWFLERCPLAQYGCQFARKRFTPSIQSSIIYNETLESFGVTMNQTINNSDGKKVSSVFGNGCSDLNLTLLPFHVLQKIVGYLDSFSVCNLALTCSLLRDVCSTFLKEKGLVLLKWEKGHENDRYRWKVSDDKRWLFSSYFEPVHQWRFEGSNNMANHLKSCPYFNPVVQGEAFNYVTLKTVLEKQSI